jgi:carbon-monoxide dehydrogenase medium subunit
LIARALPHIAHPAVRNRGTIGGSIAYADPAAELPACLLALGAEIVARGPNGERVIAADDFFRGLFETALAPGEMITSIRVPAANADTRIGFAELARRHGDYALVGLAATARANGKGLSDVRLAFFGVGNTALRQPRSERALAEGDVEGAVASLDLNPNDDIHATGAVRKHLAGVLLRRVAVQLMDGRA